MCGSKSIAKSGFSTLYSFRTTLASEQSGPVSIGPLAARDSLTVRSYHETDMRPISYIKRIKFNSDDHFYPNAMYIGNFDRKCMRQQREQLEFISLGDCPKGQIIGRRLF